MYFQWKLGFTTLAFAPFLFAGSYFMARVLKGDAKGNQKILEKSTAVNIKAFNNSNNQSIIY